MHDNVLKIITKYKANNVQHGYGYGFSNVFVQNSQYTKNINRICIRIGAYKHQTSNR